MSRDKDPNRRTDPQAPEEFIDDQPLCWLSTEDSEQELFAAVITDSTLPRADIWFESIDAYFAAEEAQAELQYRRSLLRLLSDLRPQLAGLLGRPAQMRITRGSALPRPPSPLSCTGDFATAL